MAAALLPDIGETMNREDFNQEDVRRSERREEGITATSQLLVTLIVFAVLVVGVLVWNHPRQSSRSTISVNGTATVQGKPDTANFQMAIHTTALSAAAALSANNVKMQALLAALKAGGVASKDVQTSGLNVYQNFNNNNQPTGYGVDDSVSVTIHGLSQAGSIIDRAVRAGGNGVSVNGVTLSISNQSSLLKDARTQAVQDARRTADQLASAAGSRVTGVVTIVDQENQPTPPIMYNSFKTATVAGATSTPISAGSQSVSVQVAVVYQIAG